MQKEIGLKILTGSIKNIEKHKTTWHWEILYKLQGLDKGNWTQLLINPIIFSILK